MHPAPSERVFCCGVTGSGKTEFLARAFLPRARRLLLVDQTGEWIEREGPQAHVVYGYDQTAEALGDLARRDSWRLVCSLEPEEVETLTVRLLVPVPNPRAGYAANIGGMAVFLDEVDHLTPNAYCPIGLRHLWRRGRHVGLSVYAATQRPANVSKEVTSMCRWLAVLRTHEVNDLIYLRQVIGASVVDRVMPKINRTEFTVFLWDNMKRQGLILDRDQRIIERVSTNLPQQQGLGL